MNNCVLHFKLREQFSVSLTIRLNDQTTFSMNALKYIQQTLCFGLLLVLPSLQAEEVVLMRTDIGGYRNEHIVDVKQFLSESNRWDLSMPFPADIQKLAKQATERLQERFKLEKPATLARISILPKTFRSTNANESKIMSQSGWYLEFRFIYHDPASGSMPSNDLVIVMLFDGTLAELRATPLKNP